MLKRITLENFVHFKEKTIIDFNTSQKIKQSCQIKLTNPDPRGSKEPTIDAKNVVDYSSLNIFVGANFCGKSTVLELIRRCMTDEINVSETTSFDNFSVAYAFCEFSLDSYDVISGIIKEPRVSSKKIKRKMKDDVYKVFIFPIDNETVFRWKFPKSSITYNGSVKENKDKQALRSLFEKKASNITDLLSMVKLSRSRGVSLPDKPSWNTIEDKYVSTLPLRGIGIVQWTKSKEIIEKHKKRNYKMACERAEVISSCLFGDQKNNIDVDDEKNIFQYITYPEIFEFIKKANSIFVKHYKSRQNKEYKEFPLLKTSEGILEAKLTSLLLAHKDFQTLCLEDPDRGMHPQMIERLRTVLCRAAYKKMIIVVTHCPLFIDTITIQKTYVFFRKKTSDSYVCSVKNTGKSKELSNVSDIETLRTLLFATKVLLVEGPTDREVVQGIFTQYKLGMIEKEANERSRNTFQNKNKKTMGDKESNKIDYFQKDITTFQVIPVGGCENTKKVQKFCKYINLPCVCLWDLDKVVKCDGQKKGKMIFSRIINLPWDHHLQITLTKKTKLITKFLEIDYRERFLKKYCNKELSLFISHEDSLTVAKSLESQRNTFIWRHGALENAILSSENWNEKICKSLNINTITNTELKDQIEKLKKKLKERLDEKQRKEFYIYLMKVDEIRRFITFLEEKEQCQSVAENYYEPNTYISEWKFYKIFAVLIAFGMIVFAILFDFLLEINRNILCGKVL